MAYANKIDLHMHSTVSDGTDTPEQLLDRVKAAGLTLFAVTDHDAVKGGRVLRTLCTPADPRFVCGVELSCRDEGGKYHILGYGFDPDAAPICDLVEHSHQLRMNKVTGRLRGLASEFGVTFPQAEVDALLAMDNPGKPHIGNLMVKYGFAESKEDAITNYIDRIHLHSEYIRPPEVIAAILDSGGIPVLAHPVYGSGDQLILGEELNERVRHLIGLGLRGLEAFYSGFSEKMRAAVLALADTYGLYVTAGSDYHGANKLVALGDTGLANVPDLPDGLRRFLDDLPQ